VHLEHFDYHLPSDLIAQVPAPQRTASRLLHLDGATGALHDLQFRDIQTLIAPNDVVVLNDTRVIKARMMGRKQSGGRVEMLVERVVSQDEAWVQMRVSHVPRTGTKIIIGDNVEATVIERADGFFRLRFATCDDVLALLDRIGTVPLPPYIDHAPDENDHARYQTVYAKHPGAVAAPTAGLHFDQPMLEALRAQGTAIEYVTLHVGAGTFQPVREMEIEAHEMHSEWYSVPQKTVDTIDEARARGGRVVAIGTTTLRALETAGAQSLRASAGETQIFILPGHKFRVVDRLLTNFHLPKSTLLMLVSAFAGIQNIHAAYEHAVAQRYRFYSYGDAMLIEGARPACMR
jgi:S-adenosylmethionine:tRNA ribosyltransferase-isomerase